MKELSELPVFVSGTLTPFDPRSWRLVVDGLVAVPLSLSIADILSLPVIDDTSPFECVDGWRVPENHWRGVLVGLLLDRAQATSAARYVTFSSGAFAMSLTLKEARAPGVLLAHSLNGKPLTPEHGAPLRLVVPGKDCCYGVKWVERLEVSREPMATGKAIALDRIQRRQQAKSA